MKIFKKILSLGCAAALSVGAVAPVFSATKANAATVSWYSYGDADLNGSVQASDARLILRMAAYIDPIPGAASIKFDAADTDADGDITSRDARLALRVASGKDTAKTANAKTAALKRLQDAKVIKEAPGSGYTKEYYYEKVSVESGSVDADGSGFGGSALESAMKELQDDIAKESKTTDKGTFSYAMNKYKSYLPFSESETEMIDASLAERLIKSTSFTYNSNGTYKIRMNFTDFTITGKNDSADAKALARIIPDVYGSEEISYMANQLSDSFSIDDDELVSGYIYDSTLTITRLDWSGFIPKSVDYKYNLGNKVSSPYAEYVFDASGYPVSAVYGFTQEITIPAHMELLTAKVDVAMMTKQKVTINYTFSLTAK